MIEMARSLPPTSFQLVTSPVKILRSCSVVRFSTSTSLFTITARPATATLWSTRAEASIHLFPQQKTSELPISTAPDCTWESPVPEPPPWTLTVFPIFFEPNSSAAASTKGWRAVDPTAVMVSPRSIQFAHPAREPASKRVARDRTSFFLFFHYFSPWT